MFCPHCGVKTEGSPIQCAACKKTIPSPDADRSAPPVRQRPVRPAAVAANGTARLGSVGDRMLALLLDRVLIAAYMLIVAALLADQWPAVSARFSFVPPVVMVALTFASAVFLYHLFFEAGFGTTLGKAVMGLQVQNESGRNRFVAVAIRNALRVIDGLAAYLVGFLVATFGSRRQRVGDAVAGTVVLEMGLSNGARAAMMVLWVIAIAAAVGIAAAICPTCRP